MDSDFEIGAQICPVIPPGLRNLGILFVPVFRKNIQRVECRGCQIQAAFWKIGSTSAFPSVNKLNRVAVLQRLVLIVRVNQNFSLCHNRYIARQVIFLLFRSCATVNPSATSCFFPDTIICMKSLPERIFILFLFVLWVLCYHITGRLSIANVKNIFSSYCDLCYQDAKYRCYGIIRQSVPHDGLPIVPHLPTKTMKSSLCSCLRIILKLQTTVTTHMPVR